MQLVVFFDCLCRTRHCERKLFVLGCLLEERLRSSGKVLLLGDNIVEAVDLGYVLLTDPFHRAELRIVVKVIARCDKGSFALIDKLLDIAAHAKDLHGERLQPQAAHQRAGQVGLGGDQNAQIFSGVVARGQLAHGALEAEMIELLFCFGRTVTEIRLHDSVKFFEVLRVGGFLQLVVHQKLVVVVDVTEKVAAGVLHKIDLFFTRSLNFSGVAASS